MKWFLLLSLFSLQALALDPSKLPGGEERTPVVQEGSTMVTEEEPAPVLEKVQETATEVKQAVRKTSNHRDNSRGSVLVGFEALSTWVPLKFTASYTHIFNKKWSLEGEWARGKFGAGVLGFDVASITEHRYSLLGRRYTGNSYNWIMGIYRDDLAIKLGSKYVDQATKTSLDEITANVYGATLGFGNRWQWQNGFTLGMDWVRINIPLIRDTNQGALKDVSKSANTDAIQTGLDRVARIPTFVLLGIYLGYTF